jgi:hypothetical protein
LHRPVLSPCLSNVHSFCSTSYLLLSQHYYSKTKTLPRPLRHRRGHWRRQLDHWRRRLRHLRRWVPRPVLWAVLRRALLVSWAVPSTNQDSKRSKSPSRSTSGGNNVFHVWSPGIFLENRGDISRRRFPSIRFPFLFWGRGLGRRVVRRGHWRRRRGHWRRWRWRRAQTRRVVLDECKQYKQNIEQHRDEYNVGVDEPKSTNSTTTKHNNKKQERDPAMNCVVLTCSLFSRGGWGSGGGRGCSGGGGWGCSGGGRGCSGGGWGCSGGGWGCSGGGWGCLLTANHSQQHQQAQGHGSHCCELFCCSVVHA